MTADGVRIELALHASAGDATQLQRYFKTAAGQYGEGDVFIGVRVPVIRSVLRAHPSISPEDVDELFASDIHEHRMAAALSLVKQYPTDKERVFLQYLAALRRGRINNWDLVDCSAEFILGEWYFDRDRRPLVALASSGSIWERRVSIIATFGFIKRGDSSTTLEIASILLTDPHDLIQKAVGWMLREVGKRVSRDDLEAFLENNAARMPRTMLSYACEQLTPEHRTYYRAL